MNPWNECTRPQPLPTARNRKPTRPPDSSTKPPQYTHIHAGTRTHTCRHTHTHMQAHAHAYAHTGLVRFRLATLGARWCGWWNSPVRGPPRRAAAARFCISSVVPSSAYCTQGVAFHATVVTDSRDLPAVVRVVHHNMRAGIGALDRAACTRRVQVDDWLLKPLGSVSRIEAHTHTHTNAHTHTRTHTHARILTFSSNSPSASEKEPKVAKWLFTASSGEEKAFSHGFDTLSAVAYGVDHQCPSCAAPELLYWRLGASRWTKAAWPMETDTPQRIIK
jgi:hypothetical protein